jgi:hypothetical protein
VARQRAGRNADETEAELDQTEVEPDEDLVATPAEDEADAEENLEADEPEEDEPEEEEVEEEGAEERSAETDAFWEDVRIDPVEIALPRGVGYTLRAYRPENEITPTDVSEREADAFPERHRSVRAFAGDEKALDDYDDDEDEELPRGRRRDDEDEDDDVDADLVDEDTLGPEETDDEDEDEDDEDEDDEADSDAAAEAGVPLFLGSRGRLYLFRSPEGLVEFVRSGAEHDLSQLATWPEVVERITPEDVVPLPEDRYELDLVVENLRAGYDAWDPELLIQAGEIARDLGYALRLRSVQDSLAPGSPLDDLDEVMRAAAGGGFGAFFARRKLKKIGAEAAPLSWRTIIGKISAAVDWRD